MYRRVGHEHTTSAHELEWIGTLWSRLAGVQRGVVPSSLQVSPESARNQLSRGGPETPFFLLLPWASQTSTRSCADSLPPTTALGASAGPRLGPEPTRAPPWPDTAKHGPRLATSKSTWRAGAGWIICPWNRGDQIYCLVPKRAKNQRPLSKLGALWANQPNHWLTSAPKSYSRSWFNEPLAFTYTGIHGPRRRGLLGNRH